jgi:hypothetical protein
MSNYLIDPDYVAKRSWGIYYLDDELTFAQLEGVIGRGAGPEALVHIKYTSLDASETETVRHDVASLWDFTVDLNSEKYCFYTLPPAFLVTVIETDVSIVATDRRILEQVFGRSSMSAQQWIDAASQLRPDLRAEILHAYVR